MIFKDKKVLITGGTGSFGNAFTKFLLYKTEVKKIYIFSRDELKQHEMKQNFFDNEKISFLIGDIRDKDRLHRAFSGIDYVVHAAAQKHVPSCEYNPFEAIQTNIIGAQNIVNAAIDLKVSKVIGISTDKAVNPINLYGSTKLCMEKVFINGNAYSGGKGTIFSCVRYGNVISSRGSVIQKWKELSKKGKEFPLTDRTMTRFWLTLDSAVNFVYNSFKIMNGGEIIIPKLRRMNILDLAEAIDKNYKVKIIGIRQGEKLHETLIGFEEILNTIEFEDHYIVYPNFSWLDSLKGKGKPVDTNFVYSSDKIIDTISVDEMRHMI